MIHGNRRYKHRHTACLHYKSSRRRSCAYIDNEDRVTVSIFALKFVEILVGLARENWLRTDSALRRTVPCPHPRSPRHLASTSGRTGQWANICSFSLDSRYNTLKCFNLSRHGRRRRKPSSISAVGAFRCRELEGVQYYVLIVWTCGICFVLFCYTTSLILCCLFCFPEGRAFVLYAYGFSATLVGIGYVSMSLW
jgi:hypothetical protein